MRQNKSVAEMMNQAIEFHKKNEFDSAESLCNSIHYAIGNGMAAGLKPAIHAWNESRDIWPNKYIFSDLDEFLSQVMSDEFLPLEYRNKLIQHELTAVHQVQKIISLLAELQTRPSLKMVSFGR